MTKPMAFLIGFVGLFLVAGLIMSFVNDPGSAQDAGKGVLDTSGHMLDSLTTFWNEIRK